MLLYSFRYSSTYFSPSYSAFDLALLKSECNRMEEMNSTRLRMLLPKELSRAFYSLANAFSFS